MYCRIACTQRGGVSVSGFSGRLEQRWSITVNNSISTIRTLSCDHPRCSSSRPGRQWPPTSHSSWSQMALRCTTAVNAPSPRDHHHDTTTTHDASQSMHLHHDATTTTPLRRLSRVPSPALRWRSGHLARRQRHCDQGAPHHRLAADVASNGRRTRDTDLLPLLSKPYTAAHIETRTSSRICAWVPGMRFSGK